MELEDGQSDILRKALAMRGLSGVSPPSDPSAFELFLERELGLNAAAFHGIPAYAPAVELPAGLERHAMPYPWGSVNIWTLQTPQGTLAVDTGCSPAQLRRALGGRRPSLLLLTHSHSDHAGGLAAAHCPVYGSGRPPLPGQWGDCTLRMAELAGHTPDSCGFVLTRGGRTLFFTGDALFAGSIGNAPEEPFRVVPRLRRILSELPPETLLCPGHGPATSRRLEERNNPFLAGAGRPLTAEDDWGENPGGE
ncbi:MAG: MBL fold metallo-hydrolase [Akkermansiaceae bacterium]|nr:MBL fold metallo-hydrolase [Akkermansiaceae bacterium]